MERNQDRAACPDIIGCAAEGCSGNICYADCSEEGNNYDFCHIRKISTSRQEIWDICKYAYDKEKEEGPAHNRIIMETVNCDGVSTVYSYPELDDLRAELRQEEEAIVPAEDDRLVWAEVYGEAVHGDTAKAVFDRLRENYGLD